MQFCVYNFRIHEIVCIWRKASGSGDSDGSSSQGSKKMKPKYIHLYVVEAIKEAKHWNDARRKATHQNSNNAHATLAGNTHTEREEKKTTPNCTCAYLIYICSTQSLYLLLALFSIHGDWINWVHVSFIVQTYVERFMYKAGDQEQTATKTAQGTIRTKGECKCNVAQRPMLHNLRYQVWK